MPITLGPLGSPAPLHTPESVLTRLQETALPSARSASQLALSKSPLHAFGQRSAPTTPLNSRFYKLVAFFKSPLKFLAETWKRRATETQLSHLLKSDGSDINLKALTDLFGNLSSLSEYAFVEKKEFYDDKLNKFWAHLNQLEGSNIRRIAEELTDAVNDPQRAKTEGSNNHLTVFSENMGSQISPEQIVHIVSTKSENCLHFWVPKLFAEDLASIQHKDQKKFDAITQYFSLKQLIELIDLSEDRNREFVKLALNLSLSQLTEIRNNFPVEFSIFIKSLKHTDLLDLLKSKGGFGDMYKDIAPLLQAEQIIFLISSRKNLYFPIFREYIKALRADQLVNVKKSSPEEFNTIIWLLVGNQLDGLKIYSPDDLLEMASELDLQELAMLKGMGDGSKTISKILLRAPERMLQFYSLHKDYFINQIVRHFSVDQLLLVDLRVSLGKKDVEDSLFQTVSKFFGLGVFLGKRDLDDSLSPIFSESFFKIIPGFSSEQIMHLQQKFPNKFDKIVQNLSVPQLALAKKEQSTFFHQLLKKYLSQEKLEAVHLLERKDLQQDPLLFAATTFSGLSLDEVRLFAKEFPKLFRETVVPNLTTEQLHALLKQEAEAMEGGKIFASTVLPFLQTQQLAQLIQKNPTCWKIILGMLGVETFSIFEFPTVQQPAVSRTLSDALAQHLPGLPIPDAVKIAFFKALYAECDSQNKTILCAGVAAGIARNLTELSEVFNSKAVYTVRTKHRKMGRLLADLRRWDGLLVQLDAANSPMVVDFRNETSLQHLLNRVKQLLPDSGAMDFEAHLPEAELLLQAYAAVEKTAVRKIIHPFRMHSEYLKQKKQEKSADPSYQYIALESANLSQPGKKFYFFRGEGQYYRDPAGRKHPVAVVIGPPKKSISHPSTGSFKKLEHKDKRSVSLIPILPNEFFDGRNEPSNWEIFSGLKAMNWERVVDKSRAIAPNAGIALDTVFQDPSAPPLPLAAFKVAANDLKILHEERGASLGDIKPANMAWREPHVSFIDLGGRFLKKEGIKSYKKQCTLQYLSPSLSAEQDRERVDLDRFFSALVTADEYAFLLTAIISTTGDKTLRYYTEAGGGFNAADRFEGWISQNVKPDYQQTIRDFLVNARGRFEQRRKGEYVHLADMLNFDERLA